MNANQIEAWRYMIGGALIGTVGFVALVLAAVIAALLWRWFKGRP